MICLTARLEIPDHLKPRASYALRELCHRVGFGLRIVQNALADISYSIDDHAQAPVFIRCNPNLYIDSTLCRLHTRSKFQIWEGCDRGLAERLDLVGGAYRLLTLMDESNIEQKARDRFGRFTVSALPEERSRSALAPLVESHAKALGEAIRQYSQALFEHAACRWPGGHRHALVLTHDCDHPFLGAPLEVAANLAKAILYRSWVHARLMRLGMRYVFHAEQDPFALLQAWQDWESKRNLRGTFYLPLRPKGVDFDRNDCKSTVAASVTDWKQILRMAEDGWEFGLHASIHMKDHPLAFKVARERLVERLRHDVRGVRHHYFALNWSQPYLSHRLHAEAGFEYDSSIAFHDSPGFRSGTCLPYAAFDPVENRELPLRLLPCTLMDGHILSSKGDAEKQAADVLHRAVEIISVVRESGGVLVLNWHQESAFNRLIYAGWIDILDAVMSNCLNDSPWTATAQEVCSYWERRGRDLDAACNTSSDLMAQPQRVSAPVEYSVF